MKRRDFLTGLAMAPIAGIVAANSPRALPEQGLGLAQIKAEGSRAAYDDKYWEQQRLIDELHERLA